MQITTPAMMGVHPPANYLNGMGNFWIKPNLLTSHYMIEMGRENTNTGLQPKRNREYFASKCNVKCYK